MFWFSITFCGLFYIFGYSNLLKKGIPGFIVQKIEFDGNEKVIESLLYKASGLRYRANIFSISVEEVKRKLEQIAWVNSVEVQRKLPNRIYIRITERKPIAFLQSQYRLYLLDKYGKILEYDGIGSFDNLPIVVGEGAEKATRHFLFILNQFPKIRSQLVNATFIGKRRWNIKINKGIIVKLPEKYLKHAMSVLEEISDDNGFFKDDIIEIDLRILDRIIIKNKSDK